MKSGIRDNRGRGAAASFLKEKAVAESKLTVVSAYFTSFAYSRLSSTLDEIGELRFLFGEPRFIDSVEGENLCPPAFSLDEDGLTLNDGLRKSGASEQCAKWIREKAEIRSIKRAGLMHGKLYHVHDGKRDQAMFFISANNGLNRAHITWLEWSLMARASEARRCRLENGLTHSEPMLTESEKADVRSFLNEMLRLMPVMGVHIFEVAKTVVVRSAVAKVNPKSLPVADVLVVPAKADGFKSAFLESHAWWAIRVAAKHRPNIKWIAAYQVQPVGAVTHIAEIDRFEPFGDEGKYKVVFKGAPMPLPKPIPYGNAVSGAMQGPRYCTKAALDAATSVADLVV